MVGFRIESTPDELTFYPPRNTDDGVITRATAASLTLYPAIGCILAFEHGKKHLFPKINL